MLRSVFCRAGKSRAPPTRKLRRSLNSISIFCGGNTRTRAAASSIASGKPSSCWQISTTADTFSFVTVKAGFTATARSINIATASYCVSRSNGGNRFGSGRDKGGTGYSISPDRRNTSLLVTNTFTRGAAVRSSLTRCSKLSNTRRVCLSRR